MGIDFIYDTPDALLLFIFIVVFLALALIGLYFFTIFTNDGFNKKFNDNNTSTYIGVLATSMSIIIAFVITNEYQTYNTTATNIEREANALYTLINILTSFDTTEADIAIDTTVRYICSIINVEWNLMQNGQVPPQNFCLLDLQFQVLDLIPVTTKQTVLYDKAIDQLNLAINLRNFRLQQVSSSLPPEFWWLLFIGVTILIVLTWFVNGDIIYRIIMTSLVTIIYSALLFLTEILDNPFLGDFGLDPTPFQLVLDEIPGGVVCPEGSCESSVNKQKFYNNKITNLLKSSKNKNSCSSTKSMKIDDTQIIKNDSDNASKSPDTVNACNVM